MEEFEESEINISPEEFRGKVRNLVKKDRIIDKEFLTYQLKEVCGEDVKDFFKRYFTTKKRISVMNMRYSINSVYFGQKSGMKTREIEDFHIQSAETRHNIITLLGISVPQPVLEYVFSFMNYDRLFLFNVGLVNWEFYVAVLSSWQSLSIKPSNLYKISLLVMRTVRTIRFGKKIGFSKDDFEYMRSVISGNAKLRNIEFCSSQINITSIRHILYNLRYRENDKDAKYIDLSRIRVGESVFCNKRISKIHITSDKVKYTKKMSRNISEFHKSGMDHPQAIKFCDICPNVQHIINPPHMQSIHNLRNLRKLELSFANPGYDTYIVQSSPEDLTLSKVTTLKIDVGKRNTNPSTLGPLNKLVERIVGCCSEEMDLLVLKIIRMNFVAGIDLSKVKKTRIDNLVIFDKFYRTSKLPERFELKFPICNVRKLICHSQVEEFRGDQIVKYFTTNRLVKNIHLLGVGNSRELLGDEVSVVLMLKFLPHLEHIESLSIFSSVRNFFRYCGRRRELHVVIEEKYLYLFVNGFVKYMNQKNVETKIDKIVIFTFAKNRVGYGMDRTITFFDEDVKFEQMKVLFEMDDFSCVEYIKFCKWTEKKKLEYAEKEEVLKFFDRRKEFQRSVKVLGVSELCGMKRRYSNLLTNSTLEKTIRKVIFVKNSLVQKEDDIVSLEMLQSKMKKEEKERLEMLKK